MKNDLHDFSAFPGRWERPSTSLGVWSLWLLVGSIVLIIVLIAMLSLTRNDVVLTCTMMTACGSAMAAAVASLVAIKTRGEQSILMVLPLLGGGLAAMLVFARWLG